MQNFIIFTPLTSSPSPQHNSMQQQQTFPYFLSSLLEKLLQQQHFHIVVVIKIPVKHLKQFLWNFREFFLHSHKQQRYDNIRRILCDYVTQIATDSFFPIILLA